MSDDLLVFEGVCWPKVHITGTTVIPGLETPGRVFYDLAPGGGGRRYRAHGPTAWWRNFVTMDRNDREQVLAFLSRRGDPSGRLERAALNAARERFRQPSAEDPKPSTADWAVEPLASLAQAWTAPDDEGVSHIDPDRWTKAEHLWRTQFGADWLGELEVVPDPKARRSYVLRVKTLAGYMVLAAANSLYRKAKMRTCARCGSWFEFTKAHAKYCSLSCRTLAHDDRRA